MDKHNNRVGPTRDVPTETKIVSGAPVKITRARSGSLGKDVEEDMVEKPTGDWVDLDALNKPPIGQARQSGYGRWIERIGNPLVRVDETDNVNTLPELLTSEHPVVQDAAEKKLRELEEAPRSRFDVIDIPEEEKK